MYVCGSETEFWIRTFVVAIVAYDGFPPLLEVALSIEKVFRVRKKEYKMGVWEKEREKKKKKERRKEAAKEWEKKRKKMERLYLSNVFGNLKNLWE